LRPRTYHVPRRLTPSTNSLVSFQPGALSGRHPSELYLTEIAVASRRASPLAISEPTARQTLGLLFPRTSPKIGCRKDVAPRIGHLRPIPPWIDGAWRFRRIGIAAAAASLQGFHPSAGWGTPSPDFSACGALALLGFILPGAFPFPSLSLGGCHTALASICYSPACFPPSGGTP